MTRTKTLAGGAIVIALFVLPACGGGGTSKVAFIAKADAACLDMQHEVDRVSAREIGPLDQPVDPAKASRFVHEFLVPTAKKLVAKLEAMDRPESANATVETLVREAGVAIAAVESDPQLPFSGSNPLEHANQIASAYGFHECMNQQPPGPGTG